MGDLRLVADDRHFLPMLLGRERPKGARGLRDGDLEPGSVVRQVREPVTGCRVAPLQFPDLALGRQNAPGFGLGSPGHDVRPSQDVALERGDRSRRLTRHRHRLLERVRDVGLRHHLCDRGDVRSGDAQHVRHRHDTGHLYRLARVIAVGSRIDDDKTAASGVVFAHQRQTGLRLVVALDDDVLEEIAKTRLHSTLVASVDIEIVGDGTQLTHPAVGLDEHHTGRIAELAPAPLEFHERGKPRFAARQFLLVRSHAQQARFVFGPRNRQLRFASRGFKPELLQRRVRARQRIDGLRSRQVDPLDLATQIVALDVELAERLAYPLPLRCRVLHRVAQGGGGVQGRKHTCASPLDVGVQPLYLLLRPGVRVTRVRERLGRGVPRTSSLRGGLDALGHREPRWLAPRLQIPKFAGDLAGPDGERLGLVTVELLLLLPTVDVELPCVRILTDLGCAAVHLRLLDAQTGQVGLCLRDPCGGRRLAFAGLGEPRARRFNRPRQLAVAARKEDLLPAPQLLAQSLVAPRLRRLPLQRAPLLLDLEDDVVDPREVLLGRFELQLRGTATRLVLRDARRFLDQLAPIGRPRTQNHADLALLDDGVGLGAEPGVHQQVVHIAKTADFAVDQVFAFAGSVEPPGDLDVPREEAREIGDRAAGEIREGGRRRWIA